MVKLKSLGILLGLALSINLMASDEEPILLKARFNPFKVNPEQNIALEIELEVLPEYKAYAEMFELQLDGESRKSGFKLGKAHITPTKPFFDSTSKKERQGVMGKAVLRAPLEAPARWSQSQDELHFQLTYQVCTTQYCLFPTTVPVKVLFEWGGVKEKPKSQLSQLFDISSFNFSNLYQQQSLGFVLLMMFILGLLTSFTPCIYPLIPITLSILSKEAHARSRWQNFLAANIYVFGMSLTYAGLGVLAASSGKLFGSYLSSPWVVGFVALVFFIMSLGSFGLFEIQMPNSWQNKLQNKNGKGYLGVLVTGLVSGLIAGPCVGPILVSVLTYIAQTQNLWLGFWALFVFSLGMGQILLVIGLSSASLKVLPRSGYWMEGVKTFFGIIMLGMSLYYLKTIVPLRYWELVLGLVLVGLSAFKGYWHSESEPSLKSKFKKALTLSALMIGVLFIFWALINGRGLNTTGNSVSSNQQQPLLVDWLDYSEKNYQAALRSKQPILIDFFADWCAACVELDEKTFRDPAFIQATQKMVKLRFDATQEGPELEQLKKRYGIVGLPTLVFYDGKGQWQQELQVTEFQPTERLLEKIKPLLAK